jgi:hypothetical protein
MVFCISLAPIPSSAQQVQQTVPRDPNAATVLARSYAAMGGAAASTLHDTVLQIEVTSSDPNGQKTYRGTIKTLAGGMLREDLALPEGPSTVIQRGSVAASSAVQSEPQSQGKQLVDAGITHIPVFSILKDYANSAIQLEYVGLESFGTTQVHHIRLRRTADPTLPGSELSAPVEFYIDSQSLLVLRLVYSVHPPSNLAISEPAELRYADYRPVSGILVPFQVSTFVRGNLLSAYRVLSFAVNQNLSDADFQFK